MAIFGVLAICWYFFFFFFFFLGGGGGGGGSGEGVLGEWVERRGVTFKTFFLWGGGGGRGELSKFSVFFGVL